MSTALGEVGCMSPQVEPVLIHVFSPPVESCMVGIGGESVVMTEWELIRPQPQPLAETSRKK